MQLKKIKVYGKLRQFLGKSYFEAAVNSPQQAMSFLMANFEGLQKHMNDQLYKIKMGGHVITEDYLSMSGEGDIQIIPIATGSAFLVPIALGAGAVAAGSALATAFTAGLSGILLGTVLGGGLTAIGTSMIIGGISELIAPQSTQNISSISDTDPAIRGSYAFNGIQNVSSSGVPIPIMYGHVFSGSIIISSGTDTAQITKSVNQGDGESTSGTASSSDDMTYTQSGNLVTITATGHNFVNGENIKLDFITGPLADSNIDGAVFGVQDVTTNEFRVSTGRWNDQTYSNSGNIVKVTERNLP
jgi:predicted phage tail protein